MNREQVSPRAHDGVDKTQKILALQDELLNVRKQISKKQSQWEKERATLLSKNQIANIQIIQLKQRIANFVKINETLSNAITNQQQANNTQTSQYRPRKTLTVITGAQNDINFNSNCDVEFKREKYNDEIRRLNKIIEEKDFQIKNLSKIGNQLRSKIQERNSLVSNLEQVVYNLKCRIQKKQQQILKAHKQCHELQEKLQQNNRYIDQTRRKSSLVGKKCLNVQDLDEPQEFVKKYSSKNSSYLIMKPTPDHSNCEIDNNSSYINEIEASQQEQNSEEEEKLLCQICSRVFSFVDFEEHAKYCGYKAKNNTKHLFERKREIEDKLQKIRIQQQKENMRNIAYRNERYQIQDSKSNREKINQIREIAMGLNGNRRQYKKNNYNDFSIKSNAYYH